MPANVLLWCSRCEQFQSHLRQGKYDYLGHLVSMVERCRVCAHENGNHELPATVDAPNELSRLQIAYCWYYRHLITTGRLTEWPGDWRDATPGVWG